MEKLFQNYRINKNVLQKYVNGQFDLCFCWTGVDWRLFYMYICKRRRGGILFGKGMPQLCICQKKEIA